LLNRLFDEINSSDQKAAGATLDSSSVTDTTLAAAESVSVAMPNADAVDSYAPFDFFHTDPESISMQVDTLLRKTGAAVLMATVDKGLPLGLFEALLGPVPGTLPESVGTQVVKQAMRLIEHASTDAMDTEIAVQHESAGDHGKAISNKMNTQDSSAHPVRETA
jgi:hypothetical protein